MTKPHVDNRANSIAKVDVSMHYMRTMQCEFVHERF